MTKQIPRTKFQVPNRAQGRALVIETSGSGIVGNLALGNWNLSGVIRHSNFVTPVW
ncbi:MAG: hypothetical protein HY673_03650 [Chloroflexi bacterium]|nr:hypothetical protein [Chloroflexota bacterium]